MYLPSDFQTENATICIDHTGMCSVALNGDFFWAVMATLRSASERWSQMPTRRATFLRPSRTRQAALHLSTSGLGNGTKEHNRAREQDRTGWLARVTHVARCFQSLYALWILRLGECIMPRVCDPFGSRKDGTTLDNRRGDSDGPGKRQGHGESAAQSAEVLHQPSTLASSRLPLAAMPIVTVADEEIC